MRAALACSSGTRARRRACVALASLWSLSLAAHAAVWPERPLRIIVPLAPGGAADVVTRHIAERLAVRLGQPVYLEHRPGAGAIVGTQVLAQATGDGHTLGLVISSHAINAALHRALPYDTLADFAPLCLAGNLQVALVAHSGLGVETVAQLLALARRSQPALAYASLGTATGSHLAGELFSAAAGLPLRHVPYNGSAAVYRDLLGGHIPLAFVALESALPFWRAGQLKLLGVTSAQRSPAFAQVPALGETLPGYEASGFFGFMAPARTPPDVRRHLSAALIAVLREPALVKQFGDSGFDVIAAPPAEFAIFLRREIVRYAALVARIGLKID